MEFLKRLFHRHKWEAAGERHANGNIHKSIEINKDRFNLSPQIVSIFTNTANILFK